jgi:hypothetical protein
MESALSPAMTANTQGSTFGWSLMTLMTTLMRLGAILRPGGDALDALCNLTGSQGVCQERCASTSWFVLCTPYTHPLLRSS